MRPGDVLRFRGPSGAPFVVTVGAVDERTIRARVQAGEWTPVDDTSRILTPPDSEGGDVQQEPTSKRTHVDDGNAKAAKAKDTRLSNASKAELINHVVSAGLLSREDASNYTRDDLAEMLT